MLKLKPFSWLILLTTFFVSNDIEAQNTNFQWVKNYSGVFDLQSMALRIDTDQDGNVYTISQAYGDTQFDTVSFSPNIYNYSIVCKHDEYGNQLWAKQFDSDGGLSLTELKIDSYGNCIITGYYKGNADFNPGPGSYILNAGTDSNGFVLKLDSEGNFIWIKEFEGNSKLMHLTLDHNGDYIVSGVFNGIVDCDPNTGVSNLTSTINATFLCKLDTGGAFQWANKIEAAYIAFSFWEISVDTDNNIYSWGWQFASTDLNPGAGVDSFSFYGSHAHKFDQNGDLVWVKGIESTTLSLAVDSSGNSYHAMQLRDSTDVDPNAGQVMLDSANGALAIVKLDMNGDYLWSKQFKYSVYDWVHLRTDNEGALYINGNFGGTRDFDPSTAVVSATAGSNHDVFMCKLNASGSFLWLRQYLGTPNTWNGSLDTYIDENLDIYSIGYFDSLVDFDYGYNGYNVPIEGNNMNVYVMKLGQDNFPVGLNDFESNVALNMFPNPTNGEFQILLKEECEFLKISIYSITGQLLSAEKFHNTDRILFNLAGKAGTYILKIENDLGEVTQVKILKE